MKAESYRSQTRARSAPAGGSVRSTQPSTGATGSASASESSCAIDSQSVAVAGTVVPFPVSRISITAPVLEHRIVRVFGLRLTDTRLRSAAEWLVACAHGKVATTVAFLNAHCVNVMYADPAYREAVERADAVFADGSGISMASRVSGVKLADNVNGTDLFPVLCEEAVKTGVSVFLLGGRPGLSARTALHMANSHPGLNIAGSHHGYFSTAEEEREVIRRINDAKPGILLVGLGVPTQELWIDRHRSRLNVPVVVGVGGLFDYYSGRIPRAPRALRAAGLEWVWRLAMEPRRLAKRYLAGNIAFLIRLAWHRIVAADAFSQLEKA